MPLNCPVCRAINELGPNCRRCKADLSMLFAIDSRRSTLIASARAALARGEFDFAAEAMRGVRELRHGRDVTRLEAVLALLQRDFATAQAKHRQAAAIGE